MPESAPATLDVDLFDFIPEIAAQRRAERVRPLVDALTCLRDVVPEALDVVVHLRSPSATDTRKPSASGAWAYCVSHAGLRHEPEEQWWRPADGGSHGWDRTPANLTPWADFEDLIGADPRRAEVAAWAESLTARDAWRDRIRPYEFWPHPETWHPDRIAGDHARPGWEDRRAAWRTVLSILSDAIDRLA